MMSDTSTAQRQTPSAAEDPAERPAAGQSIEEILAWPPDILHRVFTLFGLRQHWVRNVFPRLRQEYERAVAEHGEPKTQAEAEPIVQALPSAGYFQWLHRYVQDCTWSICRSVAAERMAAIEDAMAPRAGDLGTLQLAKDFAYPGYYQFDFHRQEGGIWRDRAGAAIYLLGARIVHVGRNTNFQLHDQFAEDIPLDRTPERIVDLGCGFGKTTFSLKKRWPSADVHGIDLAAPCLELGRRLATDRGLEINWRQADMEMLPDADNSADLATITMVLHEMPAEAVRNTLSEALRVLKPGGLLVFLENRHLGDPFHDMLRKWYSEIIDEPYGHPFRDLDILGECRAAGFAEAEQRKWYLAGSDGAAAEADPRRWSIPWGLTLAWKAQ